MAHGPTLAGLRAPPGRHAQTHPCPGNAPAPLYARAPFSHNLARTISPNSAGTFSPPLARHELKPTLARHPRPTARHAQPTLARHLSPTLHKKKKAHHILTSTTSRHHSPRHTSRHTHHTLRHTIHVYTDHTLTSQPHVYTHHPHVTPITPSRHKTRHPHVTPITTLKALTAHPHTLNVTPHVGRIIGKGGQNVRDLQRQTGSVIKLLQQGSTTSEDTTVHIVGPFFSVQSAQRRIRAIIQISAPSSSGGGSTGRPSWGPLMSQSADAPVRSRPPGGAHRCHHHPSHIPKRRRHWSLGPAALPNFDFVCLLVLLSGTRVLGGRHSESAWPVGFDIFVYALWSLFLFPHYRGLFWVFGGKAECRCRSSPPGP
ncbi:Insulin-like growth factor 2 mRNA-binding protein 2 [Chionoecetes opilio]|uniref:Insulin-like growth factor 2 mRNA-binding protein 2 n=1 Tax=Chionoecetes opilio TaxID=41210 RepID=A0A8J4Y188_CHIOP|nr:Insulin-like growth factor 2 mRNA-binding protein 2 [Chionoecetes opilio]